MRTPFFDLAQVEAATGMRLLTPPARYRPDRDRPVLPSDAATWLDVCQTTQAHQEIALGQPRGWPDQWTLTRRSSGSESTSTARDALPLDLLTADPMRNTTWHRNSTARAGLHHMGSTGRLHWHESLFEKNLLIALDFDGGLSDLASQPFTLTWTEGRKTFRHTPDFLAVIDGEVWVLNVRPAALMNLLLLRNAAAVHALCRLHGWRDAVVTDYARPALTVLTTLAAACGAHDPFGLTDAILNRLGDGPARFGDLVAATSAPAVARAVLQRLLWDQTVSTDLNRLLTDDSMLRLTAVTS